MAAVSQASRTAIHDSPSLAAAPSTSATTSPTNAAASIKSAATSPSSASYAHSSSQATRSSTSSATPDGPVASLNSYRQQHQHQHHLSSPSNGSLSPPGSGSTTPSGRSQRPGGFLAFAAAAIDKTIGGISDQAARPRNFNQGPSRLPIESDRGSSPSGYGLQPGPEYSPRRRTLTANHRSSSSNTLSSLHQDGRQGSQVSLVAKDPISQPYSETVERSPLPIRSPSVENKMHQTSSRLLRMTDDDRPFTKDFKDLFSTLIVSLLPLSAHRVRLTKVEHTFLSEDAINNLGSLKFSQSNRMPDPKDPSRIVTTTTTTTFSMAKDMARVICQRFLEARFIESADGKYQQVYTMKGSVWQLTPKGVTVLDRFCSRNGIQQKQVAELTANALTNLVILEREPNTDKLINDRGTVEVIFRRFAGLNGRNVKATVSSADSDSLSDYRDGITGVKMAGERKVNGKTYRDTFTGKAAADWLMDCCTTVDRRETIEIGSLFVEHELIDALVSDKTYQAQFPEHAGFHPTKQAIYHLSAKGRDLVNGSASRGRTSESDKVGPSSRAPIARDSNTQRLDKILNDAALRLLFRENLRETHCEENLSFYVDVEEFVRSCRHAIRTAQKTPTASSMDGIKEIMAQAYGIYNAFLAPGSPCELNIDHQLRNNLATRMTKAVGQDVAMIDTLQEVMSLFEDAQNAVFKLMASDSVPKFLRSGRYEQTLKNYDLDSISTSSQGRIPERSQSRSNRK